MERDRTRKIVTYAMFIALIFLLALTPLGYMNYGAIELVIIHLPVIIGAILLGTGAGALFGFFFGLTSLLRAITAPTPLALILLGTETGFGVYNLILIIAILFVPRILVGVVASLVYKAIGKRADTIGMGVAALAGSLTNTVLFLGITYLLAADMIARAFGMDVAGVASLLFAVTGLVNGGIEAAAAVILCTLVAKPLKRIIRR